MKPAAVKAIADTLDGRERWKLLWLERQASVMYCEIRGPTLNALIDRGLVTIREIATPRSPYRPVTLTGLGCEVSAYLRTVKTMTATTD